MLFDVPSKFTKSSRKQKVRNYIKRSNFLQKENCLPAYMKKVYNVVPEIQYEHNYLKEHGIPLVSFEWESKGEPIWEKQ